MDSGWTGRDFNDSLWARGPGGVGYGDGDDLTVISPALSVYCRYRFRVDDPSRVEQLILEMDYDDGYAAYLNGVEIARAGLGSPGSTIAWDQPSDGLHEAQLYRGMAPERTFLGQSGVELLDSGINLLAVQVHNENPQSSDLTSNVFLMAGVGDSATTWREPPEWFSEPFLFEGGHLPVMVIRTGGQAIPDEPRITAQMGLIWRGEGEFHTASDPYNQYDGRISIEIRGKSSQDLYEKKSYSFETQTESGENNNVSLLGLPGENDFVLYGPYGDKSLIRNVLAYDLFRDMGHYSPRTRFVEVVIDGDYKGLYLLTEKLKIDRDRVAVARLTPADTFGDWITGGYLMRVDKTSGLDPSQYWESPIYSPVNGHARTTFQYFDPEASELAESQKLYIREWLTRFEEALGSFEFADPVQGYRPYMDIPSTVDLMILNEFTKDVDAYGFSHYFYKHRDSWGGKLVQGPPWDYNLTFGNVDFAGDVKSTTEWVYNKGKAVFWWDRLMEDPWFRNQLYCRWEALHEQLVREDLMHEKIDLLVAEAGEAVTRNFERWPVLGEYVWPNVYVGEDYESEIRFLKTWIGSRIEWLDTEWGGRCSALSAGREELSGAAGIRVYPNPSDLRRTRVALPRVFDGPLEVRITGLSGQIVWSGRVSGPVSEFPLPDLSHLAGGTYFLTVEGEGFRFRSVLVKI